MVELPDDLRFHNLALRAVKRFGVKDDDSDTVGVCVDYIIITYRMGRMRISVPGPPNEPEARIPLWSGDACLTVCSLLPHIETLERFLVLDQLADV